MPQLPLFVAAVLVLTVGWATQQGRVPTANPDERTPHSLSDRGPG